MLEAMSLVLPKRVTEEEFLALPESHDHVELIDGEVILSPSPLPVHQLLVLELAHRVKLWTEDHPPSFVGLSPLDVRIQPGRILQPDLFVLCPGLERLDALIEAVPDLVVEVLSSQPTYDRLTKRLAYAEAGVPEYWIVDPVERTIELVTGLETRDRATSSLQSATLEDLSIDVGALFAKVLGPPSK